MSRFSRKDILEALFDEYFLKHEGFIIVKLIRPFGHKTSTRFFPNLEILAKERYGRDDNVFFGICPREKMKPGVESIRYITALWAGLDLGPDGYSGRKQHFTHPSHAAKAIRSFPLAPSVIVESGKGIHLYWLLDDVVPITDFGRVGRLLDTLNTYFQCTQPVGIDSMMRLPGTVNAKTSGNALDCYVKYLNTGFRYNLEQFDELHLATPTTGPSPPADTRQVAPDPPPVVVDSGAQPGPPEPVAEEPTIDAEEVEEYLAQDKAREQYSGRIPTPDPQEEAPAELVRVVMDVTRDQPQEVGEELPSEETDNFALEPSTDETLDIPAQPPPMEPPARPSNMAKITQELSDSDVEILTDESPHEFADRIADRIVERLKAELIDEIIERLVDRLTPGKMT